MVLAFVGRTPSSAADPLVGLPRSWSLGPPMKMKNQFPRLRGIISYLVFQGSGNGRPLNSPNSR